LPPFLFVLPQTDITPLLTHVLCSPSPPHPQLCCLLPHPVGYVHVPHTLVDGSVYQVTTNAQLLALSKCTSIDYLFIWNCADCTQAAWCGLQLQSITGQDPYYNTGSGWSLNIANSVQASAICAASRT
jgi:hypothetical protein